MATNDSKLLKLFQDDEMPEAAQEAIFAAFALDTYPMTFNNILKKDMAYWKEKGLSFDLATFLFDACATHNKKVCSMLFF